MKKTFLTLMMIWIMAASVCGAAFSASAEESAANSASAAGPAAAETSTLADTGVSLELFLPENYEQYLELENPSDFAINDNYIAIADSFAAEESCIYILRRGANERYYRYEHTSNNVISSLNFYTSGATTYLFFLETGGTLFYLDCSDPSQSAQIVSTISPYSILFSGSDVYYAKATDSSANIYHTTISVTADGQISLPEAANSLNDTPLPTSRPAFSSYRGTVYLASGKSIYTCTETSLRESYEVNYSVYNFSIIGTNTDDLIYVSTDNYLYFHDDSQTELRNLNYIGAKLDETSNKVYITASDGRILRYNLNAGNFDDYEIARYSDSGNRIGAASDISVYGGKLVLADSSNERILIRENGAYLSTGRVSANTVCAGRENFLAITSASVILYSYTGENLGTVDGIVGRDISAAAYANGCFYLITTDGKHTYEIDALTCTITREGNLSSEASPSDLAADLFGNLYVLSSGYVNRYTNEQFFSPSAGNPQRVATFETNTTEIVVDYAGNLYAITGTALYAGSIGNSAPLDFTSIAYRNGVKLALSFTFDLENGDMYILSDGFVAKADLGENSPAALNNIDAEGLYESLHGSPAKDDAGSLLVNVPAGSVLLSADSAITSPAEVYPYAGYTRIESSRTGVRICTLEAGTVVAFYEYTPSQQAGVAPAREYSIALVLNNADNPITQAGGYTASSNDTTGYTTNSVGLYRFPLMQVDGRTIYSGDMTERLAKSTKLAVLGTIQSTADENAPGFGLDFSYYFVEAIVDGKTVYGFIPTAYILSYDAGASWEGEPFSYRNVRRGESITLQNSLGTTLELSNEERVRVYGEPNEENLVYVIYTDETGSIWSGMVDADLLYEAGPSSLIILAVVALVTAVVLVSSCYLILRKQPTMQ